MYILNYKSFAELSSKKKYKKKIIYTNYIELVVK